MNAHAREVKCKRKNVLGNRLTTRRGLKTRVVRSADNAPLSIPGKKSITPQQTIIKSIRFQLSDQYFLNPSPVILIIHSNKANAENMISKVCICTPQKKTQQNKSKGGGDGSKRNSIIMQFTITKDRTLFVSTQVYFCERVVTTFRTKPYL